MFFKGAISFQNETASFQPLMDLYETDDALILKIDLPGINPEEVLIKVCDDMLIVEGVKREKEDERKIKYVCMERRYGSFRRMLKMPVSVNSVEGKASYNEGVLTVVFPKTKDKVFKIKIEK